MRASKVGAFLVPTLGLAVFAVSHSVGNARMDPSAHGSLQLPSADTAPQAPAESAQPQPTRHPRPILKYIPILKYGCSHNIEAIQRDGPIGVRFVNKDLRRGTIPIAMDIMGRYRVELSVSIWRLDRRWLS
jgi:hypothetical protein